MSKYGVFLSVKTVSFMEIAHLNVRFNAYGSTIDAEGEEEEEIVEDEEEEDCRSVQPFKEWTMPSERPSNSGCTRTVGRA